MFEPWQQHHPLIEEIAEHVRAPFYVYDLDRLATHIQGLQDAPINLWYAVKANPLSAILSTLHHSGMKFDVASEGELTQVLRQAVPANNILHTGPGKTLAQFEHFLKQGVRIFVLESREQVSRLNQAAEQLGLNAQALLRVQLDWQSAEKNVLGGQGITPFGLDPEHWHGLMLDDYQHIKFIGLHIFQWGNILSADKLLSLWQTMLPPLKQLADSLKLPLQVLDLGGGLGIPYHESEAPLQWENVCDAFNTLKTALPGTDIWMELGRYAVGECGAYVTPVIERKTVRDHELLVTEGGINHLIRPAITQQAFPAQCLGKKDTPTHPFQIHGPLCTALDNLGTHNLPATVDAGDNLLFAQCGAYGFTESMPWFLCHTLAAEVVIKDGTFDVIRAPESPDVWMR